MLNAIAILSEDRFLARSNPLPSPSHPFAGPPSPDPEKTLVGFTTNVDPGFGGTQDTTSVKAKIINLIRSVRTVARSMRGRTACSHEKRLAD